MTTDKDLKVQWLEIVEAAVGMRYGDEKGLFLNEAALIRISTMFEEAEQDRRDAERLDWLEVFADDFHNIDRITSVDGKFNGFPSLRAAIDAAMADKGEA